GELRMHHVLVCCVTVHHCHPERLRRSGATEEESKLSRSAGVGARRRNPERVEGAPKDPENSSHAMPLQGVLPQALRYRETGRSLSAFIRVHLSRLAVDQW